MNPNFDRQLNQSKDYRAQSFDIPTRGLTVLLFTVRFKTEVYYPALLSKI